MTFRRDFWTSIVLCILTMLTSPALAAGYEVSDFTFSHLGLTDGLNSPRIHSLRQTDDGAVWITTKNNVARYNGVSIENFEIKVPGMRNIEECNPHFVQSDENALQVFDAGGRIYEFNPVQNHFDLVADVAPFFKHYNKLNDVYKEGGTYWLAMGDGVFLLQGEKIATVASGMFANRIIRGPEGLLLFGTRKGLKSLRRDKEAPMGMSLEQYLPYDVVSSYYDAGTKRLWLGTYDQGVVVIDDNGICTPLEGIPHNPIRSIVSYDGTTMLVGIDGCGVYQTSRTPSSNGKASLLFNANNGPHGAIHGNGVYALLVDSWDNLFIGTYSGGIDIARPVGNTVTFYKQQSNTKQALPNGHVNCVTELSPSAWAMGTDDGISIFTPATGVWQNTAHGQVVLSLCQKPDGGGLIAATYGNGVCQINAKGEVSELYGQDVLGENHVHDLLYDKNGHLWIGCQDAQLVEVTKDGFRYYTVYNTKSMALLPDGRIAVGTVDGLYIATPGQKQVEKLKLSRSPSDSTQVNRYVLDIFVHDGRYLDIATDGEGFYVYDLRKGQFRQFTTKDGLPSNTVTSITQDSLGRLWFATDCGLSFAPADSLDKLVNINYLYGLQCEYSYDAAIRLANGNLLFGSENGAVMVNPHALQNSIYKAGLRIKRVSCPDNTPEQFNELMAKMLDKQMIELTYDQRTFDLYFESINLRYQFDIAYQYRIGNGSWSQLSPQNFIRFVNLESGTHLLTIRAVSKANRITLGEQALSITVCRPWWNSWWMWCTYIALIALLFYGAWWTYELHTRYMRLAMKTMERTNERVRSGAYSDGTEAPRPTQGQEHTTSVIPADKESQPADLRSAFVDAATKSILNNISDSEFTIDRLCREMAMSRTMFYVRLKSLTGKSPQEFIRVIRLERAAALLRSGYNVGRVADEVGFDNAKYFSTAFKKYFGVSPSEFKKQTDSMYGGAE